MRETTKFKTTKGTESHELELHTYITGGEARQIQEILLGGMKMGLDTEGETSLGDIDPTIVSKSQDKAIELVVVAIDGNKEGILETVLSFPQAETQEVIDKINEIQNSMTEEKKTK